MVISKKLKYVVVAGMVAALAFAPATKAIASVTSEMAIQEAAMEAFIAEATAPENQTVAGTKTAVNGYYTSKGVDGVAISPATESTSSFVKVTDTDKKKSTAAVATANIAAAGLGTNATVGPCINVTYGQKANGKYEATTAGSAGTFSVGIPKNFQTAGASYALVAVYAGGAYKVYPNTSTDPSVIKVTVDEAASADVMYALVKY